MDTGTPTRLLIIDDEAAQVQALCETLTAEGYSTTGFTAVAEALDALRAGKFDIVLTDLTMPQMDGIAFLRAVNRIDPDVVGIVMTGHGTIATAVEAMKAGALDYILKPFNLSVILRMLARTQAMQRLRRENTALLQRLAERTVELEGANLELRAANRELEAFSHCVSHDLRAPLRTIVGLVQVLLEDFGSRMPSGAQAHVSTISGQALRMGHLIEDLLRLSHLGRQPLSKEPVDVSSLVRDVVGELRPLQGDRKVEILIGELPQAAADPSLLRQVFLNLLANALKFTRQRPSAVIRIEGSMQAGGSTYRVADNGAGFDMGRADQLFRIFQRLHRADEFEGTGVGLSIAQRIVERHGGKIWAQAQENRGATFSFTLPDQERSPLL
ncbi:MAG: Response regulator receiver sensor signal transduction histidine kinase [Gammaproteobacteria bacterium]|nr:Response regulator receiver sensor signal transduction histidine kinase [Gammaproteobacteria bacterium]